jgi:type I restriction enzyme S subunit
MKTKQKNNWQIKKLGDICDFQGGSQPPKSNFIFNFKEGFVRFLQIRDFQSDKNITYIPESKKNRLCNKDDILIGRYGASVGKILFGKNGAYNVAIMKTIPNLDFLDRRYFYFYLISDYFQRGLSKVSARSAQAGFSKDDIYDFPVLLPPLPEQKRIVKILDEVFAKIEQAKKNAEQNLNNAKELFESTLAEVFDGGGDDWEEKKLGDVCELENGDRGKNYPAKSKLHESGYPFVNAGNLQNNGIVVSGKNFVSDKQYNLLGSGKFKIGDLLFCLRGSLGKFAIVDEFKKGAIASSLVIVRNKKDILETKYLFYYFKSSFCKKMIKKFAGGTAQPNLGAKDLKKFTITIPKSLKTQKQIVKKLDALSEQTQKLEKIYQRKVENLDELKKSFLQKAFAGEL